MQKRRRIFALVALMVCAALFFMLSAYAEGEELPTTPQKWDSPIAVILLVVMVALVLAMGYFKLKTILNRQRKYSRTHKDRY